MTSCTIIVSHFESLPFLRTCIRQIRKYDRLSIKTEIIIADQSSPETFALIKEEYAREPDVHTVNMKPLWSGYGLDYLLREFEITTKYIAQLHVDAFPISHNWLKLPITLIEEDKFSFVGQLQFISKPTDTIYPPEPFFCMAQCFNVALTSTYKLMAEEAGFTRFHNRNEAGYTYKNNDWAEWASHDWQRGGSDDDSIAFHWQDKHTNTNKLGLAISGYIQPQFGRIIEDIIFHFGSANEARGVMDRMPELYQEYTKRINENYSDELIEEMVELARLATPPELEILSRNYWDGTLKQSSAPLEALNQKIEWLKK